jgi:hypothetical protein
MSHVQSVLKDGATLVAVALAIIALSKVAAGETRVPRAAVEFRSGVSSVVGQARRYADASAQDGSEALALAHAAYGAGYFSAARDLVGDAAVARLSRTDVLEFAEELEAAQRAAATRLADACPAMRTSGIRTVPATFRAT